MPPVSYSGFTDDHWQHTRNAYVEGSTVGGKVFNAGIWGMSWVGTAGTVAGDVVASPFRFAWNNATSDNAAAALPYVPGGNPSSMLGPDPQGIVVQAAQKGVKDGFNPVSEALKPKP